MRVLILNSCRKWIGEAAHCFDLQRELTLRGHHAILVCRRGYALEEKAREAGAAHESLEFCSQFSPPKDWRDLRALRALIAQERIDLLHCHRGKDHWVAAVANRMGGPRLPLVRTRHVVTPSKIHVWNRWIYSRATDCLISVSQKAREGLGRLADSIPADRSFTIYSAVDAERFHPSKRSDAKRAEMGAGPDDLLVGLVGRLQNIKGHHIFIEAAAKVAGAFPNARFVSLGRGREERALKLLALAKLAGIGDRFRLYGFRDDLAAVMAGFDLGAIASLGSEGSSRVGLEYMASGVPVVATRVGGIPELLKGGELGRLVEPNDANGLAAALAELLSDAALRKAMADKGRENALKEHGYDRWMGEIFHVYETAARVVRRTAADGG